MPGKNRFTLTAASILVALMLSAMWTVPAFADDSTPPPVETPTEVAPPINSPVVDQDVLSQVPEGTEVVVLNESGNVIPLASQEAAQAIIVGDPVWCPSGVAPVPSASGPCSPSYGSLSALTTGGGWPGGNGTIWIQNVPDSGVEVVIDGLGAWSAAKNFALTLQGGWTGTSGSKTILGVSTFDTAINIVNWNGAVTVNDITMNGVNNAGFGSYGALYIETSKNILLSNVTIVDSLGSASDGAYLDNRASTTQATVTVKNSSFNGSTTYGGLSIYSDGAVTLTNVNANGNYEGGAYIQNNNDTTPSLVTVTNSSFNGNFTDVTPNNLGGLEIYSNGAVKLSQVTANGNGETGVYVDNSGGTSAQSVTVTGSLTAIANGYSGLEIYSRGILNLTNLTTNLNGGYGTYIDNTYGTPMAVNITGTNVFDDNYLNGLYIQSKGAITLNNITAIRNGITTDYQGVYIYNNYDTAKPQPITLKGYGFFLHNGYTGFEAYSYGAITLNNVTASDNGKANNDGSGNGVYLYNGSALTTKPAAVTINGTNSFTYNDAAGLEIGSRGTITLSNITASNNDYIGAYVYNNYASATKGINLQGTNNFNQNGSSGLEIYSYGAIAVNNVTAYNNSSYGAYLFNAGGKGNVTITGFGRFEYNAGDGLYVESNGAITTNNLSASSNQNNGVNLYTIGVLAPQAVTLNGTNNFNYNGNNGTESGLIINADGSIKLNNVNASYNYYNGAILDNFTNWDAPVTNFLTFGSVTITGYGNFTGNINNSGLYIDSHGAATLNYITVNYNANDGVGLDVDGNVTVVCSSANNNAYGFYMYGAPTPLLTLKGLITAGNTFVNEALSFVTLVRTRCP